MRKNLIDRIHERFATSSLSIETTSEDIKNWNSFINSFKEPRDCYELAYYRYRCRMYYFSLPKRIAINILGLGALFIAWFYLLVSRDSLKEPIKGLAVLEKARDIPDFTDIVPNEIFAENDQVEVIENHNEKFGVLCKEAKQYYWNCVKRYPFSFFFNYFVYMELVTHSGILLNQNPEITIVYINERNVANPILTDFYQEQGRKLFSFMHGEYPLQLVFAFMRFSRYYIWANSYKEMFSDDLRCKIDEYVIYTPQKLKKKWNLSEKKLDYFCTYYFSGEDEDTIRRIVELLQNISIHGLKCKVRPHPRDIQHLKLLNSLLADLNVEVESPNKVTLQESLAYSKYIVGLQSTVLSEAFVEGKEIVLDDISNREHFEVLKLQKYNVFNKPHMLFSDLLSAYNID